MFCETRQLAEEYTYRFLAAANAWATTEHAAMQRISPIQVDIAHLDQAPAAPTPSTAEVRAWARSTGLPVPDRGRLRPRSGLLGTTPTPRTEPSVYGRVLRSPPDREAHRSHETRCASNPGCFTSFCRPAPWS
ncbi:lsr2 family protein [Mycobacteroides abscessus subsp. bolletii 103]|nr:lsr2 family protein [Mycobacteroides abscessus subsp. bolletii 103]